MRIIGGKMRGTKLQTLDGFDTTRPTLDRVKESLFNIISAKVIDAVVLDLFSGSGALGIESISRGAKEAYLCDSSLKAVNVIKNNVSKTKSEEYIHIINNRSDICLSYFKNRNITFDIIFLDPPYESDLSEKSVKYIVDKCILKEDGIIIIETDNDNKNKVLNGLESNQVEVYDIRKYGRVALIFLKRKG